MNEPNGKYRAWKIRAIKESGLLIILQHCFPSRARLKLCKARKPIPPSRLGLHNWFQDNHAIFCLSPLPHQKARMAASIEFTKYFAKEKQDMMYVGMAWSTTLINTSFLAHDNVFSPHPLILFQTRCMLTLKNSFLDFSMTDGIPKYLSNLSTTGTPNTWVIFAFFSAR